MRLEVDFDGATGLAAARRVAAVPDPAVRRLPWRPRLGRRAHRRPVDRAVTTAAPQAQMLTRCPTTSDLAGTGPARRVAPGLPRPAHHLHRRGDRRLQLLLRRHRRERRHRGQVGPAPRPGRRVAHHRGRLGDEPRPHPCGRAGRAASSAAWRCSPSSAGSTWPRARSVGAGSPSASSAGMIGSLIVMVGLFDAAPESRWPPECRKSRATTRSARTRCRWGAPAAQPCEAPTSTITVDELRGRNNGLVLAGSVQQRVASPPRS